MEKITSRANKLLFSAIIFWIIISIVYTVILTSLLKNYNLPAIEIVLDSAINNLLLVGCCLLIFNNMRFYLPRREKYWYVLTVSFVLAIICYFIAKGVLLLLFKNDDFYGRSFDQTEGIRFGILFLLIASFSMMTLLLFTQEEEQAINQRKADIERLSREAELFNLRQQLQPHFLFNSLNSISALTGTQPERARHMIQQLSDFLRGTIKKDDQQWNSLVVEVEYLKLYLDIEKVRFGHRLQTDIRYSEDVINFKLPTLLLQPLVENAIKFGLYDTTDDVLIEMEAKLEDGFLNISVTNPFDPETSQPLKGTGFGLPSVRRRLFLLFARHDLLKTTQEGTRFNTTILIPQIS